MKSLRLDVEPLRNEASESRAHLSSSSTVSSGPTEAKARGPDVCRNLAQSVQYSLRPDKFKSECGSARVAWTA